MKRFFLTFGAALIALPTLAWGPVAQKTVNQLAIYGLPAPMQPFYYHQRQALVDRALEPDTRLTTDPREAPRHYIDIDYFGLNVFSAMPKEWEAAAAKYSADTLYSHGIGPWAILESFENLKQAFRDAAPDDITKYSIELANYVGDLSLPLHTSEKFDPGLGGLTGLWETKLVEKNLSRFKLYDGDAKPLKPAEVAPFVWALVRQSYTLTDPATELEADVSRELGPKEKYTYTYRLGKAQKQYSDKFAEAYFQKVGGMVAGRLKASSDAVAVLWATAWDEAGKPNLTKMLSEPIPKDEKNQLAADLKSRKDFKLVPDGRLLALKASASAAPKIKPGQEAPEAQPLAPADSAAPATEPKVKIKEKKKKKDKDKEQAAEGEPTTEPANPNFSPSDKP